MDEKKWFVLAMVALSGLVLAGSLADSGEIPVLPEDDVYYRTGNAFHDDFRLDIGERIEFRFRNDDIRSVQLINITPEGQAEIVYGFVNGHGGGAMVFFAGIEDMGFPVEVVKMTENKALLVIPHPITQTFPD
ncbi:hypothetical protein KJ765_00740 [Candidatus Micrarchaeota archaeon]|nr:hypothetical protein [Candidatus Micrarchaeota archaeon]